MAVSLPKDTAAGHPTVPPYIGNKWVVQILSSSFQFLFYHIIFLDSMPFLATKVALLLKKRAVNYIIHCSLSERRHFVIIEIFGF